MASSEPPLRLRTIGVYALPATASGFMTALISFYFLKFSTDVLLLAPGVIGLFFAISRFWDAATDPLVGYWSDRTRTRLGRRRPWFLAAALPLGLVFVGLWAPPTFLSGSALVWWMGIGVILFYSAHTVLVVPHASLGAELSLDHHERTRVFAGRLILDLSGVMLAAGAMFLLERTADARATASWIAAAAALVCVLLILFATGRVRERPEYQGRGGTSPYASFGDVLRNPHARILIAVFLLEVLGFSSLATLMPYAMEYWFHMQGMGSIFIGSALGVMALTIPIWIPLSRRFGKRNVWTATLFARALAFGAIFFMDEENWTQIIVSIGVIGATYGGGSVLGPSVKADVIDYDELQTGERKEGAYFASWNLSSKAGAGLAIALTGLMLQSTGFQPNVEQTPTALLGIKLLFSAFPCLFYTLAGLLMLRLRLSERDHLQIRAALDQRASEGT